MASNFQGTLWLRLTTTKDSEDVGLNIIFKERIRDGHPPNAAPNSQTAAISCSPLFDVSAVMSACISFCHVHVFGVCL